MTVLRKRQPKRIVPKANMRFNAFPGTPKTAGEAAAMIVEGQRLAETAKESEGMDAYERERRSEAFIMKGAAALEVIEAPSRVAGGEVIPAKAESLEKVPDDDSLEPLPGDQDYCFEEDPGFLLDRTKNPDMVGLEASRDRMRLADQSQCLELALDASASIKGANSLEKMLAHQMAAAHRMAMRLMGQIEDIDLADDVVKLSGAAARLMTTFQNGMQTLSKVRTGGKQEVVVQHVHVTGDAQAVVAGKMDYPTGGRGQGGGKSGK